MEGFDLFRKYLAKHHLELDFSKLDMEEVEKEILANRPTKAMVENNVVTDVAENVPTDPSPSSLPWKLFIIIIFFKTKTLFFWGLLFWARLFAFLLWTISRARLL